MLVFDEVQTGMGRTGDLFAYQGYGVTPDIMAAAKGLGGGFPIGACLASARAAKGMTAGAHGSTFGGNPLGCAVGLAVLDAVTAPGFLQGVNETGEKLIAALQRLAARNPEVFTGVRGRGLMLGLQVTCPPRDFVGHARDYGVMTAAAGTDVVRILPPLNIAEKDVAEAERRLDAAAAAWIAPVASRVG